MWTHAYIYIAMLISVAIWVQPFFVSKPQMASYNLRDFWGNVRHDFNAFLGAR